MNLMSLNGMDSQEGNVDRSLNTILQESSTAANLHILRIF